MIPKAIDGETVHGAVPAVQAHSVRACPEVRTDSISKCNRTSLDRIDIRSFEDTSNMIQVVADGEILVDQLMLDRFAFFSTSSDSSET